MTRIDQLADKLREQLGIPDDVRPDALDILRRMKIAKVISDFVEDTEAIGRIARWDSNSRVIYLSSELWDAVIAANDNDARFTVLHEVGHAVLGHTHRNRLAHGKLQFGRFVETDEADADQFALAFAIPLKFAEQESTSDVEALAIKFGLPADHAGRRLADLQRYVRALLPQPLQSESDNYADAMSAMRINTINWNS